MERKEGIGPNCAASKINKLKPERAPPNTKAIESEQEDCRKDNEGSMCRKSKTGAAKARRATLCEDEEKSTETASNTRRLRPRQTKPKTNGGKST